MEKIQDYALIGNGRSAALVSKKGSIDWLAWPRFDSPSLFASILDDKLGGFWKISPSLFSFRSHRNYIEDTNVLETHFQTTTGKAVLTDFMTAISEKEKKKTLQPEHELIREVRCEEGEMEMIFHYSPRPDYGRKNAKLKDLGALGFRTKIKNSILTLRSSIAFSSSKHEIETKFLLKKGEKATFFLTFSSDGPTVLPPFEMGPSKLNTTVEWWKNWTKKCRYHGPFRKEVIRSALVLKLLSFAPSGAFIASPTTSLPEKLQGDLNWDYRFCWIRDAAFTAKALFSLGYNEDAEAFVSWLLHSTRLSLPKLNVLYDVYGRKPKKETILTHLKGYFGSKPVRISNAAKDQFQLDCYGELMDAVAIFVKEGGTLDSEMKKMVKLFGKYVLDHWMEPDNGIWEYREKRSHYTYSKVMCWVTLDRLIQINKSGWIKKSLLQKMEESRDKIRDEIEKKGWNIHLQTYTETLNGSTIDSSLLLMSLYDFESAKSEKMQKTAREIMKKLFFESSGLIYRGENSSSIKEGAFLMCSFWLVDFFAKSNQFEKAKKIFSELLDSSNDVGLFSEEMDPHTKDALGNFPQTFTHIALINSALAIGRQNGLG